jgi:hypothetical protein
VREPQRYWFLDLYRGLIVFFMVEGHALRALLVSEEQRQPWFVFHELVHGIVGPGFLFGAGFAFAIATRRRWEQALTLSTHFFRRLWRAVLILIIGYLLHLPYFSLRKSLEGFSPQEWNAFLAFDALQCIGLTLIVLRLLLVTVRSERLFVSAVMVLLFAVAYATPLFWDPVRTADVPLAFSQAINGLNGSFFPLFPNAGFLLAGTLVAWLFLRERPEGKERGFINNLGITGIVLILTGLLLDLMPVQIYPVYDFWFTSPNFFWIRLGVLFLMLSGLWYFEYAVSHRRRPGVWMPKWLTVFGIESFFVYIAHLIVLYGWVLNPNQNASAWWGLNLSLLPSLAVTTGFVISMILLARGWNYGKKHHPVAMQGVYWWMGSVFLYYFVTNPW